MKKMYCELFNMLKTSPVRVGQLWRHYKGDIYKIEDLLVDCNTNEITLAYTYADPIKASTIKFSRPMSEWLEEVEPGIQRFSKVCYRSLPLTEREFEMVQPLIGKNYKEEKANERLGRMRKLLGRISRRFGY